MRFGQASMEMLLITGGVVLAAVVAGYYAISSTASVFHELNSVAYNSPVVGDNPPTVTLTINPKTASVGSTVNIGCSASDDYKITSIMLSIDSSPVSGACSISGKTASCSYTYHATAVGSHSVSCVAEDNAAQSGVDAGSFTVGDTPPTVSATYADLGSGSYSLKCFASDDVSVSSIKVYLDGLLQNSCSIGSASGSCTATVSPGAGSHELNCVAEDSAGQTSSDTVTFTVGSANSPPVASFTYSPTNPTTADDINFISTSSDPDRDTLGCFWSFGDGATAADCNTTHKYTSPGTYTVELNVVDPSGAFDIATQTITVTSSTSDTSPPSVALSGVPSSWQNSDATVSVSCTDTGSGCDTTSYRIYLSNTAISSCPTDYAQYTYSSPTTVSSHVWACGAAKDNAGNVGFSKVYEINVDKVSPTTTVTPTSGTSPLLFRVNCSDAASGCANVYHVEQTSPTCPSPGSAYTAGTFGFLTCNTTSCTYYVCTYAVDNAGNQETPHATKVTVSGSVTPPPSPVPPPGPIPPPPPPPITIR